jgi:hypothetical protein
VSITRPTTWTRVLVIIVVIYLPTTQLQEVLTSLIALAAVLVSGSAVSAMSARQAQTAA